MIRLIVLMLAASLLAACASSTQPAERGPMPTYEAIRDAQNSRVELLDRIWTQTVVRVDFKDEDGQDRHEQFEGNLQIIQPSRLLLTFTKVGDLLFIVGGDEDRYWWIRLGRDKQATVGRYDNADRRELAQLEIAVHPLDFLELLAIRSLPEAPEHAPAWSDDGLVHIRQSARWGMRHLYFDPVELTPRRVELTDASGDVAAYSDLTRYEPVDVKRDKEGATPSLPQRFWVYAPTSDLSVKVNLYSMESNDRRPRSSIFDFDQLVKIYKVTDIVDLDGEG